YVPGHTGQVLADLLPYLEQTALYEKLKADIAADLWGGRTVLQDGGPPGMFASSQPVGLYLCPADPFPSPTVNYADPSANPVQAPSVFGRASYFPVAGAGNEYYYPSDPSTYGIFALESGPFNFRQIIRVRM